MPISLEDLGNTRRSFTLETEAGPVRLTYRPYEMTPAREAAIARIADETTEDLEAEGEEISKTEGGWAKLIGQFCTVVEAWDLVGPLTNPSNGELVVKKGEPIPVNPENMRYVSSYFMIKVLQGVADDVRPKKTRPSS